MRKLNILQRNDAYDGYNTYPLHHRPSNGPKDAFKEGVQHTQCVLWFAVNNVYWKFRIIIWCRQPIVTGTSVLAIKYKDGIMMAADNLGMSWSSLDTYKWIMPLCAPL